MKNIRTAIHATILLVTASLASTGCAALPLLLLQNPSDKQAPAETYAGAAQPNAQYALEKNIQEQPAAAGQR